jgi:hypothetical protein
VNACDDDRFRHGGILDEGGRRCWGWARGVIGMPAVMQQTSSPSAGRGLREAGKDTRGGRVQGECAGKGAGECAGKGAGKGWSAWQEAGEGREKTVSAGECMGKVAPVAGCKCRALFCHPCDGPGASGVRSCITDRRGVQFQNSWRLCGIMSDFFGQSEAAFKNYLRKSPRIPNKSSPGGEIVGDSREFLEILCQESRKIHENFWN